MPEIILAVVFGFYLLLMLLILFGMHKKPGVSKASLPFVSVIVPARNEEGSIGACIDSLLRQNYPPDLFEIIIVNDGSEDRTAEIVESHCARDSRVKLLASLTESSLPPGKARALETGLRAAKGEIIFNTDADCTFTEGWLRASVELYESDTAMVNGVTLPEGGGWFGAIQTLDFAFLHGVAAGFSGLGLPLAGMGNNMSYRKEVFLKTGGFEKLGFSVTEDFQLTRAILALGEKVVHSASDRTLVTTRPMETFAGLFNQKKRWAAGGLVSPPVFYLLFLTAWLAVTGSLTAPFVTCGGWGYLPVIKIFADFLLIWQVMKKVKIRGKLRYFLFFELYLSAYVLIFPLIIPFSRAVRWKGRIFR